MALSPHVALAQQPVGGLDPGVVAPDLRDSDLPASAQKGNFVAVPIPFSNPVLGVGVVGAVGYFHAQTEAERKSQPASLTGFGVMYTDNKSYAAAAAHVAYWKQDRWRFTGALGYADVDLPLVGRDQTAQILDVEWLLEGSLFYSELSRRVGSHWYVGLSGRHINVHQDFEIELLSFEFDLQDSFEAVGLGPTLTFDTRDIPTNAYEGRYFRVSTLLNRPSLGSDLSYQDYSISFRSYHTLKPSLVLAWELVGCKKSAGVPLWDACMIGLRGFAATDYLGKSSVLGQVEARWKFNKRWGMAAFAGAGKMTESFNGLRESEVIPSYGIGVRFMVETAKRINMRLDYGRSTASDAVYLSVGEAF